MGKLKIGFWDNNDNVIDIFNMFTDATQNKVIFEKDIRENQAKSICDCFKQFLTPSDYQLLKKSFKEI